MATLLSSRPIEYSSLKPLGEGSSGAVYQATRKDIEFGIQQTVAIKILNSQIPTDDWHAEFASLSLVNSNRCVRVLGWDHLENRPALVLELIHGVTLDKLVRQFDLTTELVEELTCQIFEGLQDISRAGISHGDLSLKNVMVNDHGEIKILDFGLYKGGRGHFTPEFAAPEIFEQQQPTFFSDLYSLGRILFFIENKCMREISTTALRLLALRPSDRDFVLPHFEPQIRAARREKIKKLVKEIMGRKNNAFSGSSLMTTIFTVSAPLNLQKIIRHVACAAMLTLSLSTGAATADLRSGYLYIRTQSWSELKLNGHRMGYSPLDLQVTSNEILNLEFKTPNGTVVRTLTVSPGQNIVLDDSFLKASPGEIYGTRLVK